MLAHVHWGHLGKVVTGYNRLGLCGCCPVADCAWDLEGRAAGGPQAFPLAESGSVASAAAAAASSPNPRSQVCALSIAYRSVRNLLLLQSSVFHRRWLAGCVVVSSQSSSVLCRPFHFLLSHLFPPPPSPAPPFFFPFI